MMSVLGFVKIRQQIQELLGVNSDGRTHEHDGVEIRLTSSYIRKKFKVDNTSRVEEIMIGV